VERSRTRKKQWKQDKTSRQGQISFMSGPECKKGGDRTAFFVVSKGGKNGETEAAGSQIRPVPLGERD